MMSLVDKFLVLLIFTVIFYGRSCSAKWRYGDTEVRGVNLGSWLVLEKWMTPAPFEGTSANDEWELCEELGYMEAEKRLRAHWDSHVTEEDIVELKNAGINHLRIPIGYWAIEIPEGEPWVSGSWEFLLRAATWARKYDLQVMIDLHAGPGSQNGKDHSGHSGPIHFFYDDENLNLATRVLAEMARRVNSTEWRNTITIIQLLNEPVLSEDYDYRLSRLKQFYRQAYDAIRAQNSEIVVAVHDAFISHSNWYYLRDDTHYYSIMLDAHYYQKYSDHFVNMTCEEHAHYSCRHWDSLVESNSKLWTVVGEWSLSTPSPCPGSSIEIMARTQISVYERGSGWFMWNFKHPRGYNEWDFLASVRLGWINLNNSSVAQC